MTISLTHGHCCACTVVCMHVGGPYLCDSHSQPAPTAPQLPEATASLRQRLEQMREAYDLKVADLAAETLRTSQLLARVSELDGQLADERRQAASAHAEGVRAGWEQAVKAIGAVADAYTVTGRDAACYRRAANHLASLTPTTEEAKSDG